MYPEPFYEGVHYVVEHKEPIEREIAPQGERLLDQNLWQGADWRCYYKGERDGDLGIPKQCKNPFYLAGYNKAQQKYRK